MITLKKLNPLVESHTAKQSEVIWFVSWLILLFTGGCSIKPLDSFEQILIHETKSVLFMFLTLAYFFKDFLTNPNKKTNLFHAVPNFRCCPKIIFDPTPTLPSSTTEATRPWTTSTCSNGKKGPTGCNCYAAENSWWYNFNHPYVPREWCRKNTSLAWSLLHERTEMMVEYMSLCKDVGSQLVGQAYACTKEVSQRIWKDCYTFVPS